MRKLSLLIALTLFASLSAIAEDKVTIKIVVEGAKFGKGQIMCDLYNGKDNFLKNSVERKTVQIDENNQAVCVYENLAKGEYAAAAIYDLDSNGEMKTNFIGLPKEPVGMSNNHRPKFGPPKFKKAKQTVDSDHVFKVIVEDA